MRTVYRNTLYKLRRGLIGWSVGVAGLIGLMVALWPSIRDMDFGAIMDQYPEAMQELFNFEQVTTGAGFLNAELFSTLLPILFITYAVGLGARIMAREEESGTMDVLLSTPLSRTELLIGTAAAVATNLAVLGIVAFGATFLLGSIASMEVGLGYAAGASLAMVLIGLVYGGIAFAVAAITGSRAGAIAISTVLAVAGYVFYVAAAIVDSVATWEWVTPFYHAVGIGPAADATAGIPLGYLWLAVASLVVVAASRPVFRSRDVGH